MRLLPACAVFLGLLIASFPLPDGMKSDPASAGKVWVMRNFTGGVQCAGEYRSGTVDSPLPGPGVRAVEAAPAVCREAEASFAAAGIAVFDRRERHLAVCAACGCPAYSVDLLLLIGREDLGKAGALGFAARR